MLPDFSKPFLQQLTEEMIAHNELVLPATGKWTLELDHDLVEMAAEFCYVNNRDSMTWFPGFLVPSDRLLMKYGKLIDFKVTAFDEEGLIGEGTHRRAIISNERFLQKCNDKRDRVK